MSGKKDAIQNLVNQLRSYLIRTLNCNYDEVQSIKSVFQRISDFLGISIKKVAFKKKSEFKSTSPNPSEENGEDEKDTGVMKNEL